VATLSELLDSGVKAYTRGQVEEAERSWREALLLDPRSERARAYLRQLHAEFPGRVGDPELLPVPEPPRFNPEAAPSAPAAPGAGRPAPGVSRSAPRRGADPAPVPVPAPRPVDAEAARPAPGPALAAEDRPASEVSRTAPVVQAASAGSFGGAALVAGAPAAPPAAEGASAAEPAVARSPADVDRAAPAPRPAPGGSPRPAPNLPAAAPGTPGYARSPWDDGPALAATVVLDPAGGLDLDAVEEKSDLRPLVPERRASGAPPASPKSDVEVWMEGARELFALGDFSGSLEMIEKILRVDPNHAEARAYLRQNESTLIAMYESKLGSLANVPRLAISPEEVMWLNLDHRAGFLLAQVDGTVNFDELFALSGLPRLDTARILSTLLADGVIR
jgi:hypothetical protein